ncbi:carboxymuconolactone decarboxylase family protein [soil metagenome]
MNSTRVDVPKFRPLTVAVAALSLANLSSAYAQDATRMNNTAAFEPAGAAAQLADVSPALEAYRTQIVEGELWRRPDLNARDRSIVTVTSMIARGQVVDMPLQFERALANGVKPAELSEIVTHLAFYTGWESAMTAVGPMREVFRKHGVTASQLPAADVKLLPIEPVSEAQRATMVEREFSKVAPGMVKYTGEVLFQNLWLRPDLAPRDRSLVTISALIARAQVAQLPSHLNRAMDNGLTQAQAAEVMTHLAFYAGWPNVFSAMPVAREVFLKRP